MKKIKCELCDKEFKGIKSLAIHLSLAHKDINHKEYYDKYLKKENEGKCYFCGEPSIFKNLSIGYHRICGSKECVGKTRATCTYEFLMYKYGLNEKDAKKETQRRSDERGLKIKKSLDERLSENPKFHREKSINTKEYWIKRGYSEEDAINKAKECNKNFFEKGLKYKKEHPDLYLDIIPTQLKYWIKKGYNEEEAKKKLSERQTTFTLEKCIKKYGDEEGLKIFNERQEKWSQKMEFKYHEGDYVRFNKQNSSNPEKELIKNIVDNLKLKSSEYQSVLNDNIFFTNFKHLSMTVSYDFVMNKKIIEFNGTYWHCDPRFYKSDYYHKNKKLKANEIWSFDNIKRSAIEKLGFKVLTVWEYDYAQNKEKILQQCIDFLKK